MALYSSIQKFITKDGAPIEGASCLVLLDGAAASPPTLYASRTGGAKSNPFLTNSQGNALCFVPPGRYKMIVTKDAEQVTFESIEVGPVSGVGSFVEGCVITDPDQWVRDADGALWEFLGDTATLPLTVPPGFTPDVSWRVVVPNGGRSVASVDVLRTTRARFSGELVTLLSYYDGWAATVQGPVGGGDLVWDATSTAVDKGAYEGFVFAVDGVVTGRWLRKVGGFVTPEVCGSHSDDILDDAPAIQSAIDYLSAIGGGKKLQLGKFYRSSGVEVLANNIVIVGMGGCVDGIGATHIKYIGSPELTNTVAAFSFGQSKTGSGALIPVKGCVLKGMTIDGNRSGGAKGSAVRTTVFDGLNLRDVHTYDCFGNYGFAIVGTGSSPRKRLSVRDCSALRCGADGMDIKAGGEHIYVENFESGNHVDETTGDSVGIDLRGQYITVINPVIYGCPEIGLRVRVNVGEQDGDADWDTTRRARVNILNPVCYGNRDNYSISSPPESVVNITNITSRLATRYGIATSGIGKVKINSGSSTENLIGLIPSNDGITELHNVSLDKNTEDGLAGLGAKNIRMFGGSIKGNGRYGIQQTGTPADAKWRFFGVDLSENLTNYAVTSALAEGSVVFDGVDNTAATSRGVQVVECPAVIEFNGGSISGNATNVHSINNAAKFRNVVGVVSKAKGSQSFAVDTATTLTVAVTHGLRFTPTASDIQFSVGRETNVNDYNIDFARVAGTSSTIFNVQIKLSAASATAGATAAILWKVEVRD